MFYAMLGSEESRFDIADVCNAQCDKLMFRHDFIDWNKGEWYVTDPDMRINANGQVVYNEEEVNGDSTVKPTTAEQVASTWEMRKQHEKNGNECVLSGVPKSLPSLVKAYRIQDKARGVGFDWKDKADVWVKVREELDELETELRKDDREASTRELGDFLFSVINAARLYHLNPDNALESSNQKFIRRFGYVEEETLKKGKSLKDMSLEEMDELWNEAKRKETITKNQ